MHPVLAEWVAKAEGDFDTLNREIRARKSPNYDSACYHAQQCAEKYLKARLFLANRPIPKIHNLTALLDLVLPLEPLWEVFRKHLAHLSVFAISARYPGASSTRLDALEARKTCETFRSVARGALGLNSGRNRRRPKRK